MRIGKGKGDINSEEKRMKLTCVTAVFNAIRSGNRERLIQCVESVSELKTEHEHLIYDGASSDGTVELLIELEARTPGLKVLSEPDTGIYNALNKGVRDARGEWFYVLGCDDHICDPALMDSMIRDLPDECDILATAVKNQNGDGSDTWVSVPCITDIFNNQCACHQGEIMRTSLARELGGFDERYRIAADSDMFLKAHLQCRRFIYNTKPFALCVCEGVSSMNAQESSKDYRTSVANVFGLKGKERQMLIEKRLLPFRWCFKLWNRGDDVIKKSSKSMVIKRIKHIVRWWLYPIVVLTRPMRCARKNIPDK